VGISGGWRDAVNAVMNIRIPYKARNFSTRWETVSFSRNLLLGVSYQHWTRLTT